MKSLTVTDRLMITDLARVLSVRLTEDNQAPTTDEFWPIFILDGITEIHAPNPDTNWTWVVGQTKSWGGTYFDPTDSEFYEHSSHEHCWQACHAAAKLHIEILTDGMLETYQWGFGDWFVDEVLKPIESFIKFFGSEVYA